jgi:2-hydroxychromene-2-carboxylate isomerase
VKHITFYLDFISPYAYLAFEALPEALQGLSYSVTYKPVFLGGLLKHTGVLGPAEVPSKRKWVYRQTQWLAQQQGVPLDLPAAHPFNPLGLLRLAVATDPQGQPNRYVCETLFRHVWVGGADAADAQRLAAITQTLAPAQDPAGEAVKSLLKAHGEQAMAADVFGVPAFEVDGKVFWGLDGLPMLRAYMVGEDWFATSAWADAARLPNGLAPRKAP